MSTLGITFIDDDALTGHRFAFVITEDSAWAFYRGSAIGPQMLEDSWRAMLAARADPTVEPEPSPRQNPYLRAVI